MDEKPSTQPEAPEVDEPQSLPAEDAQAPNAEAEKWKAEARRWEKRAKGNKAAAEKAAELEAENAKLAADVKKIQDENARLKQVDELAGGNATLRGLLESYGRDSMADYASKLSDAMASNARPVVAGAGGHGKAAQPDERAEFVRHLFGG